MDYGKKEKFGGFNILKYKKDDMSFIKVSTIMGNWSIEYREDSSMFHFLNANLEEDQRDALHVLLVNAFMVSNFVDAELQHSVMLAAGEFEKRVNESAEEVSEEEDQKILNEERTSHEFMEEMEALKNEE